MNNSFHCIKQIYEILTFMAAKFFFMLIIIQTKIKNLFASYFIEIYLFFFSRHFFPVAIVIFTVYIHQPMSVKLRYNASILIIV